MSSVARGDGGVPGSSPLTRYYLESGTPAGVFLGSGLAGLAGGAGVPVGTLVSEQALWRLLGMLADPVTGDPLGRRPASSSGRSGSRPVAGFDLTFSVPKSVSVLWALADAETQAVIHQAHRDAIGVAIGWAEDNVVFTRTGAGGRVQTPVRGLVCAAFDHWDSRTGDPHLHTHVVVANRVQTANGTWRTLDGATLFRYTVALSELHEGIVEDLLTERLGVTWTARARAHSMVPRHDIDGVPVEVIDAFSSRSAAIADAKDELVADFAARHGRQPTNVEVLKLRQQATLQTRPDKQQIPLAERMAGWRNKAQPLDRDPTSWTAELLHRDAVTPIRADTADPAMLAELGARVLGAVAQKRAVFGEANLLAETHRQLHGLRFATPADRLSVAARVTTAALGAALPLDQAPPHELHRGAARYTTTQILDAETRLLDAGRALDAPSIAADLVAESTRELGPDQAAAIAAIATSARSLDLLVGPAGTGKTTSLTALRDAWEDTHGEDTVIGLAPSAAAAQVLGDELSIATENTAKWLVEQDRLPERIERMEELLAAYARCSSTGTVRARRLAHQIHAARDDLARWTILPGQLVIIDEASLAGTLALDAIVETARTNDAKVLLVGDFAQLGAIDAGGAFHMLANDRPDVPELTTVRRFTQEWEGEASLQLREGNPAAIDAYTEHGRVQSGPGADVLHAVFDAWRTDIERGLDSAMIALDDATVHDLNALAQAHYRDTGHVRDGTIPLADRHTAGLGDRIITRRNDRRFRTDDRRSWVKNGDTWTITTRHPEGSITARSDRTNASIRLPEEYLAAHAELGYATTIHRAQGCTVDTAHAVIDTRGTREALYVAATRARESNNLYVTTEMQSADDAACQPTMQTADEVLAAVLKRSAAEASAHSALPPGDQAAPPLTPFAITAPTPQPYTPTPPPHSLGI